MLDYSITDKLASIRGLNSLCQIVRHILVEEEGHAGRRSRLWVVHLTGDKVIDLGTMIFVIGEALVNLRTSYARKAAADFIYRCAIYD